jgi:hypothetical protein
MEQETETEKKECPACLGDGWVGVEAEGEPRIGNCPCPLCLGAEVIPADEAYYLIFNPRQSKLEELLEKFRRGAKEAKLRFPGDYSVHAAVEADDVEMACKVAASRNIRFTIYTVIQQPDGKILASTGAHAVAEQ